MKLRSGTRAVGPALLVLVAGCGSGNSNPAVTPQASATAPAAATTTADTPETPLGTPIGATPEERAQELQVGVAFSDIDQYGMTVKVSLRPDQAMPDRVVDVQIYDKLEEPGRKRLARGYAERVNLSAGSHAEVPVEVIFEKPLAGRRVVLAVFIFPYGSPEWGPAEASVLQIVKLPVA